jgi:hypothetical protein
MINQFHLTSVRLFSSQLRADNSLSEIRRTPLFNYDLKVTNCKVYETSKLWS